MRTSPMQIIPHHINETAIAEIVSDEIVFGNVPCALDVIANCGYQGFDRIIVYEKNLPSEFFDLKTQLAGEILQKFSNYNSRLAIVGNFSKYESKSLRDFIYESNKIGRVNFVSSVEEAKSALK